MLELYAAILTCLSEGFAFLSKLCLFHLEQNSSLEKAQNQASPLLEIPSPSPTSLPVACPQTPQIKVLIDLENIRVTSIQLKVWIDYLRVFEALQEDGSALDVTFFSTTLPKVQSFNYRMKKLGYGVVEKPVIFDDSGHVKNSNVDDLITDSLIGESPPSKFSRIIIFSGDYRFAESARLLTFRGQSSMFVGFDFNTSKKIKTLARSHELISYLPLESIPGAILNEPPRR